MHVNSNDPVRLFDGLFNYPRASDSIISALRYNLPRFNGRGLNSPALLCLII